MSPFVSVKKNSIVIVGGTGADHVELSSIEVIQTKQQESKLKFQIYQNESANAIFS